MAENVSHQSSEALVLDSIWSQLTDDVTESILRWLPIESVARFRTVCKEWNNRLSGEYFLTWRRENFKEDPWLLIVNNRWDCYRLNVSTMQVKAFPVDHEVSALVGGLVLTSIWSSQSAQFLYNPLNKTCTKIHQMDKPPEEDCAIVCNPVRETFVQLPRLQLNKEHGIIVGDILWTGDQYQVVAVHMTFIEVYDFSKKSWIIVQQLPERRTESIVFFKGLFFCILRSVDFDSDYGFMVDSEFGLMIFSIKEDCTCDMVNLFSPIPKICPWLLAPQMLVCGSTFFLAMQDSVKLYLWELVEYDNNPYTSSNPSWKAIATMPQELSEFATSGLDLRVYKFKCLAVGNYICFTIKFGKIMVFFNTEDRSWSCFSVADNVEYSTHDYFVHVFEPRLDISIQ